MRYTLSFLLFTTVLFSQEKIKHTVSQGETIYSICKKYQVKESEIFELNPKAKSSALQLQSVLWIPNKNAKQELNFKPKEKNKIKEEPSLTIVHEVLAKETLYGIAKKYSTTVDKIKELNPSIKELKQGSKISIQVSKEIASQQELTTTKPTAEILPKTQKSAPTVTLNGEEEIVHDVVAKETKYGISKQYNISIAELEKLNPKITKGLSVGDHLIIREGTKKKPEIVIAVPTENKEIVAKENPIVTAPMSASAASKAEFLIAKATENLGTPYRSGGTDSSGFDCSGLMFTCYKQINITLPRTSADMAANAGTKVDKSQAQKGDLIFFDTMNRGAVSHVGMVTETTEDEIKFIHSANSGVIISSTKEEYYSQRFIQVNRVLEN